jgi:hypothetical protein
MQITYNNEIKERFIPISYDEILKGCLKYFSIDDAQEYTRVAKSIHLYYYHLFYHELQKLKDSYTPFNPDSDVVTSFLNEEEYQEKEASLFAHIIPILNHANYEILTQEALQETMNKTSPYGVEVSVDFDDFEEIQLYFRGESHQTESRRDPRKLYLKTITHIEPVYRRLFLIIKPKHIDTRAAEIAKKEGKDVAKVRKKLLKQNPLLITDSSNRSIYIKLFKNIPQIDLEMLFPNTKVKMTLFDKVKLGVLGGGGTVGGGSTLIAKLSAAAIDPISALMALGAFGGILWRQVKEVFTRRTHYMAQLAKNLYFHNLDNNAGALNYMIDMAGEEESKEALLVYLFLSQNANDMNKEKLDSAIEIYVSETYGIEMDFEVDDGLDKLRSLGILIEEGGVLKVTDPTKALQLLDTNNKE